MAIIKQKSSASWELDKFGRLVRRQQPHQILLPVVPISNSKGGGFLPGLELGPVDLIVPPKPFLPKNSAFSVTYTLWIAPSGKKKVGMGVWGGQELPLVLIFVFFGPSCCLLPLSRLFCYFMLLFFFLQIWYVPHEGVPPTLACLGRLGITVVSSCMDGKRSKNAVWEPL